MLEKANAFAKVVVKDAGLPNFFSGIATVSNTWREFSGNIYRTWVDKFGIASAKEHVKHLPPALSQRTLGLCHRVYQMVFELADGRGQNLFGHCIPSR